MIKHGNRPDKFRRKVFGGEIHRTKVKKFTPQTTSQPKLSDSNDILIYSSAFGEEYVSAASLLMNSVKHNCRNTDFVLLTDHHINGVNCIDISQQKDEVFYNRFNITYNADSSRRFDFIGVKMLINKLLNTQKYEWIIYIDADCLVLKDIRPLLTAGIMTQRDVKGMPEELSRIGIIDRSTIGHHGICCGFVAVNRKHLKLFDDWFLEYECQMFNRHHFHYTEQAALNKVLFYDFKGIYDSTELITFEDRQHERVHVVHYAGKKFDKQLNDFLAMIGPPNG